MTPIPDVMTGLAVGCGFTIVGRIIFDWLKNRNGNDSGSTAETNPLCGIHSSQIEHIDTCLTHVKQKTITLDSKLEYHEKQLAEGKKDFKEIKGQLSTINTNIGVLLDRADQRRKNDG